MNRAVVKFNPLPDTDRARAEHDDFPFRRLRLHLVFLCMEGRVIIRRHRFEFCCTCIDHLIARQNLQCFAHRADFIHRLVGKLRNGCVRKPNLFRFQEMFGRDLFLHKSDLYIGDALDLAQEPSVDFRDIIYLVHIG